MCGIKRGMQGYGELCSLMHQLNALLGMAALFRDEKMVKRALKEQGKGDNLIEKFGKGKSRAASLDEAAVAYRRAIAFLREDVRALFSRRIVVMRQNAEDAYAAGAVCQEGFFAIHTARNLFGQAVALLAIEPIDLADLAKLSGQIEGAVAAISAHRSRCSCATGTDSRLRKIVVRSEAVAASA